MKDRSSDLVREYVDLNEEEAKIVDDCIKIKTFDKSDILLREGQVSKESYHVLKGCLRIYYLVKGEEKTVAFYTEGQTVSSFKSYTSGTPSRHYLACVEDSTLVCLTYEKEQELYSRLPIFESLCRQSAEKDFGENQEALADYIIKSPEERYLHLMDTRPELLTRVPQYHLATYLGVKPESLSRIRKRIAEKGDS
ncbi:cyclic nucleotide-binding protein (plasmid) [Fulvitalea axinellae]|uniref:Cyclic nucleotide-binding protein n=1 Tax=Fulvitalea axinellae TaxID=1182444 RepID=A0AAU9CKT3_9BACT|nr:cyclic nucleotide-binding protein [Fulvitalea axinellae]